TRESLPRVRHMERISNRLARRYAANCTRTHPASQAAWAGWAAQLPRRSPPSVAIPRVPHRGMHAMQPAHLPVVVLQTLQHPDPLKGPGCSFWSTPRQLSRLLASSVSCRVVETLL